MPAIATPTPAKIHGIELELLAFLTRRGADAVPSTVVDVDAGG